MSLRQRRAPDTAQPIRIQHRLAHRGSELISARSIRDVGCMGAHATAAGRRTRASAAADLCASCIAAAPQAFGSACLIPRAPPSPARAAAAAPPAAPVSAMVPRHAALALALCCCAAVVHGAYRVQTDNLRIRAPPALRGDCVAAVGDVRAPRLPRFFTCSAPSSRFSRRRRSYSLSRAPLSSAFPSSAAAS